MEIDSYYHEQPLPVESEKSVPVWNELEKWIEEEEKTGKDYSNEKSFLRMRVEKGLRTYGTMLKTNNGRDAIRDATEEAGDLLFYIMQASLENKIPLSETGEILSNTIELLAKLNRL